MRLFICCLLVCSVSVSANTRIGFGSCFNQDKSAKIWKIIGDSDLDGFLFLGDNIYASRDFSRAKLEAAYAKASVVIPWDRLGPIQATWDDHDFGRNDGGADFSERLVSQRLFWQFFGPLMDVSQPASEGVYNSTIRVIEGNKVQIIALDTRSFRGRLKPTLIRNTPGAERYVPNPDVSQSMLGETQWAWLEEQLNISADIRIIMSSIQVIAEGHGWERWGNLPHERDRLLDLLKQRESSDLLLISGDRHVGGVYQTEYGNELFIEVTSSGLNMAWSQSTEYLPNQLGTPIRENHFAVLVISQYGLERVTWYGDDGSQISSFRFE